MSPRGSFERAVAADQRGQTLIDYQIGIAIFVLATAFLFLFLPGVFTPHTAAVDASHVAQSDRVAADVLDLVTMANASNTLDDEATEAFFTDDDAVESIPIRGGTAVNVTLVNADGEVLASAGDHHDGESTAATTRTVSGEEACPESELCYIEVLVWP